MRPPPALVQALRLWADHALDRLPHPQCSLCQWHAATSAPVYLTDDTRRGCAVPICGICLCTEDFPARIAHVVRATAPGCRPRPEAPI
jgi:hypothetical protein